LHASPWKFFVERLGAAAILPVFNFSSKTEGAAEPVAGWSKKGFFY
jgi:hypothetical protein